MQGLRLISNYWDNLITYLNSHLNYVIIIFIVLFILVIIGIITDVLEKRKKSKESQKDKKIYRERLSVIASFLFFLFLVAIVLVFVWLEISKKEKSTDEVVTSKKHVITERDVRGGREELDRWTSDKAGTIPRIEVEMNGKVLYIPDDPAYLEMLLRYEERGVLKILKRGGSAESENENRK